MERKQRDFIQKLEAWWDLCCSLDVKGNRGVSIPGGISEIYACDTEEHGLMMGLGKLG